MWLHPSILSITSWHPGHGRHPLATARARNAFRSLSGGQVPPCDANLHKAHVCLPQVHVPWLSMMLSAGIGFWQCNWEQKNLTGFSTSSFRSKKRLIVCSSRKGLAIDTGIATVQHFGGNPEPSILTLK